MLGVAAPVAAQDEVTLDLWNFGAMGLEELIDQYEAENGITVNILEKGYDEHHESLIPAFASGQVPDIAAVEVGFNSLFKAQPQNFTDLRQFGAEDIAADYVPWRWEQGVAQDGTIIGIPTDLGGLAFCYRADLFAEAGLPTDRDEVSAAISTWDGLIDLGKQYTEATGKAFIDGTAGSIFDVVQVQGDQAYYDDDGTPIYETSPQIQLAWDTAVKGIEAGISANIEQFTPEWNAAMSNGDFAALSCPAWMMNYIQGQAPDTAGSWDIAQVPEVGGNWGGTQLTIPAASDNPEEAYALISWLLSPENQLEVFKLHGNFPSVPALWTSDEVQSFESEFFSGAPAGQIYGNSADALEPIYEGPQQRTIDREFGNGLRRIEAGQETVEEAWNSVIANIKLEVR
jgi:cellobiose transport system substrate-binding protein